MSEVAGRFGEPVRGRGREVTMQLEAVTERGPGFVTASVLDPFSNVLGIMYNRHYLDILDNRAGAQ